MWSNLQETADLVTFIKEIYNGKLTFFVVRKDLLGIMTDNKLAYEDHFHRFLFYTYVESNQYLCILDILWRVAQWVTLSHENWRASGSNTKLMRLSPQQRPKGDKVMHMIYDMDKGKSTTETSSKFRFEHLFLVWKLSGKILKLFFELIVYLLVCSVISIYISRYFYFPLYPL